MNVILFGPPGAGKGSQAELLAQEFSFIWLSSGELLRQEIAGASEIGRKVKELVSSGELISDEIVLSLFKEKISSVGGNNILFDGFPRTIEQASMLDEILLSLSRRIDFAVVIEISEEGIIERIKGRYHCQDCGSIYNSSTLSPSVEGVCDDCGGSNFSRRSDDDVATARKRIGSYNHQTGKVIDYYRRQGVLHCVDGSASVSSVNKEIRDIIHSIEGGL